MAVINLGLITPVLTLAGTTGQIYVNGGVGPLNGNIVLTLDPSITGSATALNALVASGGLLYGYIIGGDTNLSGQLAQTGQSLVGLVYGGDTNLSGALTSASGYLVNLIQSAAGVLSLNNATGLLTLTSAPANANYVKVTSSGTTIMVSGDSTPLLSGVNLAGGGVISGNGQIYFNTGLQLPTNLTPAGGVSFGPNTNLYSYLAGRILANSAGSDVMLGLAVGGVLKSYLYFDGTNTELYGGNGSTFIKSNGTLGLTLDNSQNTALARNLRVASGIFFADTGNYTNSGAASIAQLTSASGGLIAAIGAGAAPNVVYTTGVQTINGVKTFSIVGTSPIIFDNQTSASEQDYVNYTVGAVKIGKLYRPSGTNTFKTESFDAIGFGLNALGGSAGAFSITGGNVGIGTTAPSAALHVSGAVNTNNFIVESDANMGGAVQNAQMVIRGATSNAKRLYIGYNTSSNNAAISAETSAGVYVPIILNPQGGKVGVGIISPNEILDISGALQVRSPSVGFATTQSVAMVDFAGNGLRYLSFGADASTRGKFQWYQAGQNNSSGQIVAQIDAAGNFGIGTTTPLALLHVTGGNTRLEGPVFMAVTGGNVGIGTGNPNALLHVNNVSSSEVVKLNSNAGNGTYVSLSNNSTDFGYLGSAGSLVAGGLSTDMAIRGQANLTFATNGNSERARITTAGQLLLGTTGTSGVGIIQLNAGTTSAAGIGYGTDIATYRAGVGQYVIEHVNGTTPTLFFKGGSTVQAFLAATTTSAQYGTQGATNTQFYTNNTLAISINPSQVTTFASGIILGTSNVTGGGISFGGDTYLSRSSAGVLTSPGTITVGGNLNCGSAQAFYSSDGTAGMSFVGNNSRMTLVAGNAPALVLGTNQVATFSSGIFFADTGNYTASGATSIAQLTSLSGALRNSALNGFYPTSVVTGNFNFTVGVPRYTWTGIAMYTGSLPTALSASGVEFVVKNQATGANLFISGSIEGATNYVIIPKGAATLWSDGLTFQII